MTNKKLLFCIAQLRPVTYGQRLESGQGQHSCTHGVRAEETKGSFAGGLCVRDVIMTSITWRQKLSIKAADVRAPTIRSQAARTACPLN